MVPPMRDSGKNDSETPVNNLFKRKWMKGWWEVRNDKFEDPITVSHFTNYYHSKVVEVLGGVVLILASIFVLVTPTLALS